MRNSSEVLASFLEGANKVILALDYSGSIDTRYHNNFINTVSKATADNSEVTINVVGFDHQVITVAQVKGNKLGDVYVPDIGGGGGNIENVLDYALTVGADKVIVFTDGVFDHKPLNAPRFSRLQNMWVIDYVFPFTFDVPDGQTIRTLGGA